MDKPDSCVVVIFGASGDLTKRKLMPALFALFKQGLLSDEFAILGTSRSPYSDDDYREKVREDIKTYGRAKGNDKKYLDSFVKHAYYLSMDASHLDEYKKLKSKIPFANLKANMS